MLPNTIVLDGVEYIAPPRTEIKRPSCKMCAAWNHDTCEREELCMRFPKYTRFGAYCDGPWLRIEDTEVL